MMIGTPLKGFNKHFLQNHHDHMAEKHKQSLSIPKVKLSTNDLPWLIGNPKTQKSRFYFWERVMTRAQPLQWIIVNSFPDEELELKCGLKSKLNKRTHGPHLLPIGPLLSTTHNILPHHFSSMWDEDHTCLSWLDNHPPKSVIYASFGSWVGPFGFERIQEIALGLEATKRPFLWVLKADEAWRLGLPKGYMERVSPRGKVVSWAPQNQILEHQALGCYLTHCGWNSTMEAIIHGKRLICYPIAGDQFVNCAYIVNVWGIGIKSNGFKRNDIRDVIERVMDGQEGKKIENRVLELREKVTREGGSLAMENLKLFLNHIKK